MTRRLTLATISMALVAAVVILLLTPANTVVGIGTKAPALHAAPLGSPGEPRRIEDYRGHVVLLNVWATWCPPCREEMPSMQSLHEALQPRGLRVVAVSIDDPGSQHDIRAFVQEQKLTFEILHDPDLAIMDAYQVTGVPQTFLIDRAGTIRFKLYAADWRRQENRRLVEELMREGF